jgi:hypothetical protein
MAGRSKAKAGGAKGKRAAKRSVRSRPTPAGRSKSRKNAGSSGTGDDVKQFLRGITENERVALAIRDELYNGSWERMREDLEARSAGRPHVFRLASRIEEDLRIIEELSAFEQRLGINLSEYLEEAR